MMSQPNKQIMSSSLTKQLETELETAGLLSKFYRSGARAVRDWAILKCVGQNRTDYLGCQYFLQKQIENSANVVIRMYACEVSKLLKKKKISDTTALLDVLPVAAFFALKFKKETYDALKEKTLAKIAKKLKTDDMGRAKREMAHYVNVYKISNQVTSSS